MYEPPEKPITVELIAPETATKQLSWLNELIEGAIAPAGG
jgi:hypothetical protein